MKILLQSYIPEAGSFKELAIKVENMDDNDVLSALYDTTKYITITGSLTKTKAGSLTPAIETNTWTINKDKIIAVIY